ncbi:uncharacterized protein LOC111594259 isoform X2 [Drosophila hydei]|nr:uncharacterized protein LOC111594259 isoform X2 [Drosophila hydei]
MSLAFLYGSSATVVTDFLNDVHQSLKLLQLSLEIPLKLYNSALDNSDKKPKLDPLKRVVTEVSDGSEVITIVKAPQSRLGIYYPVADSVFVNHNQRAPVNGNGAPAPNYNPAPTMVASSPGKGILMQLGNGLAKGNSNPGKATEQAPNLAKGSASPFPGGPSKGGAQHNAAGYSPITGWLRG